MAKLSRLVALRNLDLVNRDWPKYPAPLHSRREVGQKMRGKGFLTAYSLACRWVKNAAALLELLTVLAESGDRKGDNN
jgi:predicted component of type VI protein secretion system